MLTNRNNLNVISCEKKIFLVRGENNRSIEVKWTVHIVNTKSTSIWHNNKLYIKQNNNRRLFWYVCNLRYKVW
jgi:hypothetical protein